MLSLRLSSLLFVSAASAFFLFSFAPVRAERSSMSTLERLRRKWELD